MKICFKCNKEKPLTDFYKHKGMAGGRLGKCKDCNKKDTKERADVLLKNPEWAEKEKTRHREKYHRIGNKKPTYAASRKRQLKYKAMYPEKIKASSKTNRMKTKVKGNHKHHWSYNEEHYKDVIELSVADHSTIHRFTIYDQERMMYRICSDGVLLDTKILTIGFMETLGIKPF